MRLRLPSLLVAIFANCGGALVHAQYTSRVSIDSNGVEAQGHSRSPSSSQDGRFVAFHGLASNLVPGDTNATYDVFVHDRRTGITTRVSVDSSGAETNWSSVSSEPSISADGQAVAFYSDADNLVPHDTNNTGDVFVHDRQTGTTTRVSVDSNGVQSKATSRPGRTMERGFRVRTVCPR
jgi:TolB protein